MVGMVFSQVLLYGHRFLSICLARSRGCLPATRGIDGDRLSQCARTVTRLLMPIAAILVKGHPNPHWSSWAGSSVGQPHRQLRSTTAFEHGSRLDACEGMGRTTTIELAVEKMQFLHLDKIVLGWHIDTHLKLRLHW